MGVIIVQKLVVFISSVIDDTKEEREAVGRAIDSISLADPWRFETATASPKNVVESYTDEVKESDVFILIVNKLLSEPVLLEHEAAKIYRKPRLIFIHKNKNGELTSDIKEFLKNKIDNIRYRTFSNSEELQSLAKKAVEETMMEKFRLSFSKQDLKNYKQKLLNEPLNKIISNFFSAQFIPLKRFSIKSPLELVKENPQKDEVLPVMVEMAKKDSILERINFAKEHDYASKYFDSWAESELELIGFKLLKTYLVKNIQQFTDMYDAGCANSGQYRALVALNLLTDCPKKINPEFQYAAQDFNSDWEKYFNKNLGKFFDLPLPLIPEIVMKYSLLCCTHVLHYFENHPIAIYTCFFSFNKLLKNGGYCYVTIPEKESQPGMLDLLEKSSIDAGFKIIKSGKERLVQSLTKNTHNITTFGYLILKKEREFNNDDNEKWRHLIGTSFFREKHKNNSKKFGITREGDIDENIRYLERDLKLIINEKNYNLRTFRYAIDVIIDKLRKQDQIIDIDTCIAAIWDSIEKINATINRTPLNYSDLKRYCGVYFFHLVEFFVISYNYPKLDIIIYGIYNMVKKVIEGSEDIRVHMDDLTDEQVARLLEHLFDLCEYENLDLRSAFEDYLKTL